MEQEQEKIFNFLSFFISFYQLPITKETIYNNMARNIKKDKGNINETEILTEIKNICNNTIRKDNLKYNYL